MTDSNTRIAEPVVTGVEIIDAPGSPFIRVSSLVAVVRHRSRLWFATALAGLVLALAFFALQGPRYSATATLLLRRATINPQDSSRAMQTDVELASSRTVAGRAISQLQLGVPVTTFLASYQVSSLTDDVLQITATDKTAAGAVQRAGAVATAFLSFRGQGMEQEMQVEIGAIQQELNTLQTQLPSLNNQINAATIEATQSSQTAVSNGLGDLLARRSQVDGQIATDEQRIGDVTADTAAAVQNTRLVDPASLDHHSIVKTLGLTLAIGLFGGFAVGVGWVVFWAAISDRVRRREEVVVALDAPVRVSAVAQKPPLLTRRRPNRPDPARPAPDIKKVARHLRDALPVAHGPRPALAVVSIDSDERAGPAAASMAYGLLAEGSDVLVVDLSARLTLASAFGVAPNAVTMVQPEGMTAKAWVSSRPLELGGTLDDWLRLHSLRDECDAVVVLATLDPAVGADHLAELAATAVAVVTAGRSSAVTLRAAGQMLRAAGIRLDSAVLFDADANDESFGPPSSASRAQRAWA